MAITGAILDFDGTLVDSLEGWCDLEGLLVKEAQAAVTREDRAKFTTFTLDETAQWFHERLGVGASAAAVRAMMDEYMVDYLSHSAQVLPGVGSFLEECKRRGIALVVASSSPRIYLETALGATGLMPYFSAIFSVEDFGGTKRESFIFERARETMGTDRATTWGFDDSLYALEVLKDAGYPTVGLYDPHEQRTLEEWRAIATIVVESFADLSFDQFEAAS